MNPRDLVLVGVRILAVYVAVQWIGQMPVFGQTFLSFVANAASAGDVIVNFLFILFFFGFPVAVAIGLWALAPRIATAAARDCTDQNENGPQTQTDVISAGMILMGIYLLATRIPQLIYSARPFSEQDVLGAWSFFAGKTLICLFAIGVILGAHGISRALVKLRYARREQ